MIKIVCILWMVPVLLLSPYILLAEESLDSIGLKAKQYVDKREYEKAAKEYLKILAANPNDQKTNLALGLLYSTLGKTEEAIRYSQAALSLQPSYAGYHNLGLIYANQRDFPKAIDAYERALKMNPASYRDWYQLGLVYSSDLKFDDAVKSYERALEVNPRFTDAALGLGSAYYWSGNVAKAREQVDALTAAKDKEKA